MKGTEYALAHPDEAVAMLVAGAPELKSDIEAAKWKATIPATISEVTKTNGLGALDRAKWEALDDLLKTYAIIETKVELSDVLKDGYR
jgi:ABC-type nitrate/sulfonate/bicarbonate transport system substrate-binding protein